MPDWLHHALAGLGELPPSLWLRQSPTAYILVNAAHIAALGLLIGSIVPLDLRLIGLFRPGPLAVLAPVLARTAVAGLALTAFTGLWLLAVRPLEYAQNPALQAKLALLGAGVANAVLAHAGSAWRSTLHTGRPALRSRLQALLSLVIWIGCVVAGRWIGFLG